MFLCPIILYLMRLGVPWKCNNFASRRYLCVFVLDEVKRVVENLARKDVLKDKCVEDEHLKVVVEPHQVS